MRRGLQGLGRAREGLERGAGCLRRAGAAADAKRAAPVAATPDTDAHVVDIRRARREERHGLLRRLGALGAGGALAAAWYSTSPGRGGTDAEEPLCKSVSVYASRGPRSAMEDEYFISPDERFFGVFDGHGGAKVSKYVRRHLYDKLQKYSDEAGQASGGRDGDDTSQDPAAAGGPETALRQAFAEVSRGILDNNKFDMQGSTAVTVLLGRDELWSTNLGDSRAVLCRDGEAVDLTEDHKPNSPDEKARIEALGGNVRWYGYLGPDRQPVQGMGAYRINGNLAVSRAFGDRLETPYVSDEPDVVHFERDHEGDRFIILASDGLWDVMTSQEAVKFVTQVMTGSVGALGQGEKKTRRPSRSLTKWMRQYSGDTNMVRAVLDTRKAKIAKYLVEESLRRGTADNVTVIVIWLR